VLCSAQVWGKRHSPCQTHAGFQTPISRTWLVTHAGDELRDALAAQLRAPLVQDHHAVLHRRAVWYATVPHCQGCRSRVALALSTRARLSPG